MRLGILNISRLVSTKIGQHQYFSAKKNEKNREYHHFPKVCSVTLHAFIFVPETPNGCIYLRKFFIYWYHNLFFIYYGYLNKIWSTFSIFPYFLILPGFPEKSKNVKFPYRFSFATRMSHNNGPYEHRSGHMKALNICFMNVMWEHLYIYPFEYCKISNWKYKSMRSFCHQSELIWTLIRGSQLTWKSVNIWT